MDERRGEATFQCTEAKCNLVTQVYVPRDVDGFMQRPNFVVSTVSPAGRREIYF